VPVSSIVRVTVLQLPLPFFDGRAVHASMRSPGDGELEA
jgi:hypothetical protein